MRCGRTCYNQKWLKNFAVQLMNKKTVHSVWPFAIIQHTAKNNLIAVAQAKLPTEFEKVNTSTMNNKNVSVRITEHT